LISILSFIVVFFHIIKLDVRLGISDIFYLKFLFQIIVFTSTIFTVTLLPTYPIFFVIFKDKEFKLLEKLNLTIVSNLSFYILVGYLGYIIGVPITALFFYVVLFIFFFSITIYIIMAEYKHRKYIFLKPQSYIHGDIKILKQVPIYLKSNQ